MGKVRYKTLMGTQPVLFPENIFDRISENHSVRLIDKVVDKLDISSIESKYKGGGTSAYHPRLMIKILFYAYYNNIYSSRKIEKELRENIYFIWLSRDSVPNFRTINYFRGKRLKEEIHHLFAEVTKLLYEMGYVDFKLQYIDGTKIESVANKYTFVWRSRVEKYKVGVEDKIKSIIQEIESQIKKDSAKENDEKIKGEINSEELKERIKNLNEELKKKEKQSKQDKGTKKARRQISDLEKNLIPRLDKYERQLEILDERNSYSKTDEDATFMRRKEDVMKNSQLMPCYNVQISTENQFITNYTVHQYPDDTRALISHLEKYKELNGMQSEEVIADAGYGSEENYTYLEQEGITAYVKYNYFHQEQKKKNKANPFLLTNLYYNKEQDYYVCPMGQHLEKIGVKEEKTKNGFLINLTEYKAKRCTGCPMRGQCHKGKGERIINVNHTLNRLRDKARRLLHSEKGIMHRKKRPVEVEAVFGQIKFNNKFRRFTLRGLDKVTLEFGLIAIGHNLRKLMARIEQKLKELAKKGLFFPYFICHVLSCVILAGSINFHNKKYRSWL